MNISYQMENIGFADISPSSLSLNLYKSNYSNTPAVHNYYIMCFVLDGIAVFKNSNSQYNLKKDQGILFFPGEKFSFTVSSGGPMRMITLGFHGVRAEDFIKRISISPENPSFYYPKSSELMSYFPQDANLKSGTDFIALSLLYKVFAYMYNRPIYAKNNFVSKALEYIDKNLNQPIRVSEIATSLGISRVYLYKAFEDIMGISPKEYITNRKTMMAYEAIKNRKVSVAAAAEMVGYQDQFAFSKIFKARYHLSPREVAKGMTPYILVIDEENGESVWPATITQERHCKGNNALVAKPYVNKEDGIIEGWILRAGYLSNPLLPRSLDISILTDNGKKGALTFRIFVENQCDITNWCIDQKDWIRFGSSTDWDTDFQYWLGWHKQIVKEGWNKIVLPFGDSAWGHVSGNPDYKAFCSFAITLSIPSHIRVFIDDIKVVPEY